MSPLSSLSRIAGALTGFLVVFGALAGPLALPAAVGAGQIVPSGPSSR